ncbi:ComEC/Rec2 family competence protein [Rickettsiales bacterium]|nr:ComEC/Rec2 family competence protein [Rickettsiales bacterium]MDB2550284.1 ComEC/Rec2 family competence protein [Rickettsiales bacterium]
MKEIPHKIQQLFFEEENNIIFLPIFFAIGILFAIKIDFTGNYFYPTTLFLLIFSSIFIYHDNFPLKTTFILGFFFFFGFLWMKFYSEKIIKAPQIEYAIYTNITGEVADIKNYYDQNGEILSQKITLEDLSFKKPKYKKKPPKKLTKRYFNSNFLGESEDLDKNPYYNHKKYHDFADKDFKIPKKIIINNKISPKNLEIGDLITATAFLQKNPENKIFDNFNYKRKLYFDQIGAIGHATKKIKIFKKSQKSDFEIKILDFRQKISQKIANILPKEQSAIISALLLGFRDDISQQNMENIRNSGLMHLFAISGLHIGLAAGFFFFLIRFLLSRSYFLTLHYDIKKISAFLAIFTSFGYLLLTGMPISAIRAFFMVFLLFLAILIDKKINLFRSIAAAFFVILLFNPANILQIGFSLSFMAVFSIIACCNFLKRKEDALSRTFLEKIFFYFIAIIFTSLIVQIFTAIFVIYHFNHYQIYGILANLAAIPLVSFIILPLSFICLFAIPLGLEFLPLEILGFFVEKLLNLSEFVANLPNSNFNIQNIPFLSFLLIIFGQILICIWQNKLRFLGLLPILAGILIIIFTPLPKFIINKNSSFFAIFQDKKLILSSDRSFEAKNLAKKFGQEEYFLIKEQFDDDNFCQKDFCRVKIDQKDILIVKKRLKKAVICNFDGNMVINLNKKYLLPKCNNLIMIDYHNIYGTGLIIK